MMMYIQMSPVSYVAADPLSRNVLFHNVYPVIPYCQPKNQNSQQPACLQLFYLRSSFQEAVIYCQYKSHWLIDRQKKKKKGGLKKLNIKKGNKGMTPWSIINCNAKLLSL